MSSCALGLPLERLALDGGPGDVAVGAGLAALGIVALVLLLDGAETAFPRWRTFRPLGLTLLVGPALLLLALQVHATVNSQRPFVVLAVIAVLDLVWLAASRLPKWVRRDVEDAPIELVAVFLPMHVVVALVATLVIALKPM